MGNLIRAADMFCGAGGISHGAYRAARRLGRDLDLVAINHWPQAVKTHAANHPWARHFCGRVDQVRPQTLFPGGEIDLITAGCECTHHSKARGGKPMDDQSRASAWHVLHWAEELRVQHILIENVQDFLMWGPLDNDRKPIRSMRGRTFEAFIAALRSLNYNVEWRMLTAADYGDPTSRRRLFIRAALGDQKIVWPAATHGAGAGLAPHRTAREIMDWDDVGASIFTRKRPLAPRTIRRIAEGLRRYAGDLAPMFLSLLYGNAPGALEDLKYAAASVAEDVHPVVGWPFLVQYYGGSTVADVDRPVPTVLAVGNKQALAMPCLIEVNHGRRDGSERGAPAAAAPGRNGRSPSRPVSTVTASKGAGSLVQPFLVQYNRTGGPHSVDVPIGTVTATDRFGLVQPRLARLDITLRMLAVRELARATSFPDSFIFTGTKKDRVRQIGNAVPVELAEALCYEAMAA